MQIDVREFRLGKWYIPKDVLSIQGNTKGYHALGYFDIIEVESVARRTQKHPWHLAYNASCRLENELQSDFFVQEVKAFTSISKDKSKGFTKREIDRFWQEDSLLLSMSMLRVSLETNISDLIKKINELFAGQSYLYYYSFDYSGIIVVAKGMTIYDYLDKILNIKCHSIALDTYSMYGLRRRIFDNMIDEIKSSKTLQDEEDIINQYLRDAKEYEIAINISVDDYLKYKMFENEFTDYEKESKHNSVIYTLPGRHDLSIVNKNANFCWLIHMQQLLDQYSTEGKNAFYSYETFIKMKNESLVCAEHTDKTQDETYQVIGEKLKAVYKEFQKNIGNKHMTYQTPVREACNSILSILRNGFAEDFVLCMYQAFYGFLKYLIVQKECEHDKLRYENGLEQCFADFFDGLSSLINSAVHADRQFIQPTSFNAIFYDVPPKIMAFYVATIHRICEVMSMGDKYKYIFLMKPAFSEEIANKIISFQGKRADDRILQITINEHFLYHPEAVMRRIVHEIAHVKGDGLRLRNVRKEKMLYTYIYIILMECLPQEFRNDGNILNMIRDIYTYLVKYPELVPDKHNYSREVNELRKTVLRRIINMKGIHAIIRNYIANAVSERQNDGNLSVMVAVVENETRNSGLTVIEAEELEQCTAIQKDYLVEVLFDITMNNMNELRAREMNQDAKHHSGILGGDSLGAYANVLESLYSETYADVQMIQILNIPYHKYLEGFIKDEQLDVNHFEKNNEDISRIALVAELMWEEGVWDKKADASVTMNKMHNKIIAFLKETDNSLSPYYVQNENLKSYLRGCFEESKTYYGKQSEKIEAIRKDVATVIQHEDVQAVYTTINKVLCEYKNYLKDMTWENFQ